MELIDKAAIVAEIERIKEDAGIGLNAYEMGEENGKLDVCDMLLSFIDSIEVKEVDLKKEFYDFLDTLTGKDNGHLSEDELFRIAEYFYELGLKKRKEN